MATEIAVNANPVAKKTFTDADYKLREEVCIYVQKSDLIAQRAIRQFADNSLGSTDYAKKTLADLARKSYLKALSPEQIELGKNLLRQHQNILVEMFKTEVIAKRARVAQSEERAKQKQVSDANTLAGSPEQGDDSFNASDFLDESGTSPIPDVPVPAKS